MATIGGLTNSTANSIRGYGGLASGLDRDTLIEGMTYGTTSKITQQQQKKQQLEWKQDAVRAISDMMIAFANKYTASLTSSTNLFSSMFWGRNNITTTGANSKFVSVTGTASAANAITIMGVKQMAKDAKWSSTGNVSNMKLQTGEIGKTELMEGDKYVEQKLVGKTLDFKYGSNSYSVTLGLTRSDGSLYDYSSAEGISEAINDQLSKIAVKDDKKLSEYITFGYSADDKIQVTGNPDSNGLKMVGGSALELLGFASKDADGKAIERDIKSTPTDETTGANAIEKDNMRNLLSFGQKVAGKELTFSYNGKTKTIKMPTEGLDGTEDNEVIRKSMQEQLDSAFGKGRIRVEIDSNKFSFSTYDPASVKRDAKGNVDWAATDAAGVEKDKTSTLTLVSGSSDLVGANGVFGRIAGRTNRVNLNASFKESGLNLEGVNFDQEETVNNEDGTTSTRKKTTLTINGVDIDVYEDDSISSLMSRINNTKEAGVSISYQSTADKFTITSTEKGASGVIKFGKDWDGMTGAQIEAAKKSEEALLNGIFGTGTYGSEAVTGQDAIVAVKYNGSDDVVELIRDSNSFTVDGLSIGVKGTFGYKLKDDGTVETDSNGKPVFDSDPVEIDARVNTDNIVDSIKSMVEEYNKIIELVNNELTTKPDRDYSPLTSEQKKELSESEIKTWEEKAKSGLLFGDSDLRSLSSDLRFVISGGNMEALRAIGITTSNLYSDNGKLTLDESKLRAALETDPESVEKLFTSTAGIDADGNTTFDGIATNLKNVMEKYVETLGSMENKGILIKKAGSKSSPISLTENAFYKQLAEINKQISKLQTRLETERDRYIRQFTSLETLISQMNSQSSYLSQIGGY